MSKPKLEDITIRTDLKPGDLGYVIYLHGHLYHKEYQYGLSFESYVAEGLAEFYRQFEPDTNRMWICEHDQRIIGSMLLMNRGESAQLRYFIIEPEYRGIWLGKKMMELFMSFLKSRHFKSSFLWTTQELPTAASLYKRCGFVLVEEKDSTAFGKPVREQKYELSLKQA
jgi:N-acetylglutamate synthase-like GNAT family acetyltransferase